MRKNNKKIKLFAISSTFCITYVGILSIFSIQKNIENIEKSNLIKIEEENKRLVNGYKTTGNVPSDMASPIHAIWWWFKYIPDHIFLRRNCKI
ncbi:MAG: hypothetical protein ACRCRZ_02795 [Metamycoplasmataceae bacterium]